MPRLVEPMFDSLPFENTSNGCFETMRAYKGRIFRLEDHLERLYASAVFLGTGAPKDRDRLAQQLTKALERSKLKEAVVRVALFAQKGCEAKPSIVVRPIQLPSAAAYRRGIRVAIVPTRPFSVGAISPQAKYSARMGSVLAVMDAQLRKVDEALFMNPAGFITESTASNFAIVYHKVIHTAPCSLGLLAGITRDVLFELAQYLRLPIKESHLTRHEVYNADEAFLTSTIKEVLSVTMIDAHRIGNGHPGPITKRLHRAFRWLVRNELRLARHLA